MKRMKLFSSILLFLLFLQNQPTITSSLQDGKIHTTISYIDLTIKYDDGGDQYENNVTVFDISTKVEVWNTGSEPQSIGYNWYNPYCGYFLSVGVNITDEVEIYKGDLLYHTQCDMTEKYFAPGISSENALIRLVFNTFKLVKLPSGEFQISAPTRNGIAYQTMLYSNEGVLYYKSQELPSIWGEAGNPNFSDSTISCFGSDEGNQKETPSARLPISHIEIFLSFLTIFMLRNFIHKKKSINFLTDKGDLL